MQAQGCPSWAGYDSPAEAAESAEAVVVGHVSELVDTREMFGATGNLWSIEVDEWRKGAGSDLIEVLSPPSACGASDDPYLGTDPFVAASADPPTIVFLTDREGGWMAISPGQGAVAATADGQLPTVWPTPGD